MFPVRYFLVSLLVAALAFGVSAPAQPSEIRAGPTVAAAKSFDGRQFSYRVGVYEEKDAYRVLRLTYPSPVQSATQRNNTIPAELYLPKDLPMAAAESTGGQAGTLALRRRPAVICLHILDGNVELCHLTCSSLAARGIPALWFSLPYYGERALPGGRHAVAADPKLFTAAIAQAVQDVRRTVDVLASRPEIDPDQIGVMGISLGGFLAASAAERDPRIARTALLLAGGDVLRIIHSTRETRDLSAVIRGLAPGVKAEVEQAIEALDPLRQAEQLRERAAKGRVLMINATADEVVPRACAEKLAAALGMADRVVWLEGLGHYTALAALPRALRATVDFFAQDLPADVKPSAPTARAQSPQRRVALLMQRAGDLFTNEPAPGRCHFADLEISCTIGNGKKIDARVRLVRGPKPKFALHVKVAGIAEAAVGHGEYPWMAAGQKVAFVGTNCGAGVSPAQEKSQARPKPVQPFDLPSLVDQRQSVKLQMLSGAVATFTMVPDVLDRWVKISEDAPSGEPPTILIARKDRERDHVRVQFLEDRTIPNNATFDVEGVHGTVTFRAWQFHTAAHDSMFREPAGVSRKEVDAADLVRVFAAGLNFGLEMVKVGGGSRMDFQVRPAQKDGLGSPSYEIIARDPAGHGLLCRSQGKTVLLVAGTPEELGAAHGTLLREQVRKLAERVLYAVGGADSLRSGTWFFDRLDEIQRRTLPHTPPRLLTECDALSRAAGVSQRDGRYANLFPERFHCSGVAVRGQATHDGRLLHARVLDYMRDIHLQDYAAVQVFLPEGRNAWMSLGYAGFLGTVTAMNEKGLAIGEMGGRGEGDWDGTPMSFLLRDIMERASTVDEAIEILRRSPRTCEYYYVVSDKSRAMAALHCLPKEMTVLRPGQQHPRLPRVPEDTVLISGDSRAKVLSDRLQQHYGKIDVPTLIDIIKRPVAMNSNLHDAIFRPESLEMWCADAGRDTVACDEPYARFDLVELLKFYRKQASEKR
jgi:dienelactone hydrolase